MGREFLDAQRAEFVLELLDDLVVVLLRPFLHHFLKGIIAKWVLNNFDGVLRNDF